METRVCRLYGEKDLRIETESVTEYGADEVVVRVGRGGICGSDLHYYLHGGFGTVRVREPIILGHEFAGTIEALGADVTGLSVGDKVAVNPSQPCGQCRYCQEGLYQHCLDMHFIGSAMRLPHEQGGFRERIVIAAKQCVKGEASIAELACAEPLAVCLHAAKSVTALAGKKVLINGAGPIGALCTAVAKYFGAGEIVVVDLAAKTLAVAEQMGAHKTINIAEQADALDVYDQDKGYFEVIFECSAAQSAIQNVLNVIRPQGTIIQVGVSGALNIPLNMLVGKEVRWIGSQRFHPEYAEAVDLISQGKIDVSPIVTDVFPMEQVHQAIEAATDRTRSVKVQVAFDS